MINSFSEFSQSLELKDIIEFSKFILTNILAWQFGVFVGHKILPIIEPFVIPIFEKNFYKTKRGKAYLEKLNLYHDLKHAKVKESLEMTSFLQGKIDFAKSRFQYLTLEEQSSVLECQDLLDNLRGEIFKDLIGDINHKI
jgi:hypothetical protein